MTTKANTDENEMLSDLHAALQDTESALNDLAEAGSAVDKSVREKISASLNDLKAKLQDTEKMVSEKAKVAARATDEYVHENPWQSIGIAAAVGFLVGLLVSRR